MPMPNLGKLLHKPKGVLYAVWGGIQAVRYAIAHRFESIDIDVHVSKDGILMAVHWGREWRLDGKPLGNVGDYTASELARAVSKRGGPWRIQPVATLMAEAKGRIVLCLEAKPDPMLERVETWANVKADADRYGCRVVVMTIQRQGAGARGVAWEKAAVARLWAAKRAGLPVMVLSRAWLDPAKWGFVDAWKVNRPTERRWGKDMPASIPWVGPGSGRGASAHPRARIPDLTAPRPAPRPRKPVTKPPMGGAVKHAPLQVPFIQARWHGDSQTPEAIVMHGTVTPCGPGWARKVARMFASTDRKASCHYIVDTDEVIQAVGDHVVAYHCGYNSSTIGFELCDPQDGDHWDEAPQRKMLTLAARAVAQTCLAYGIEAKHPTVKELKAQGPHGIYGHNDSRLAFGRTTHTDPVHFPWPKFMAAVRAEIEQIESEAKK